MVVTSLWLGSGEPEGWTTGNMIGHFLTTEEWKELPSTWNTVFWVPKTNHPLYFLPSWGPEFFLKLDFMIHSWPSREDRRANIVHFTTGRSLSTSSSSTGAQDS